jgi:hypothetical protein
MVAFFARRFSPSLLLQAVQLACGAHLPARSRLAV